MVTRLDEYRSKKKSELKGRDHDIPYLHWLNSNRDALDKKWIEMNGDDVEMEGNMEYAAYIIDSYIEWYIGSKTWGLTSSLFS